VEISSDVVLDPASLITDQVAAGVFVRSAILNVATGAAHEIAA
jgi:aspartate carbamoyltransferase catalytic subunit